MDPQSAYDALVSNVHAPIFFNKLAQVYGWQPSSEEEAIRTLKMAGKIRNVYEAELVKSASAQSSTLDSVDDSLDNLLASYGYSNHETGENIKAAAYDAMQYPQIKEAALAFVDYLSKQQG